MYYKYIVTYYVGKEIDKGTILLDICHGKCELLADTIKPLSTNTVTMYGIPVLVPRFNKNTAVFDLIIEVKDTTPMKEFMDFIDSVGEKLIAYYLENGDDQVAGEIYDLIDNCVELNSWISDVYINTFGNRFLKLLKDSIGDRSVVQFAKDCGIAATTMRRILSGEHKLDPDGKEFASIVKNIDPKSGVTKEMLSDALRGVE